MSDIYLSLTETPTVVTLSQPVVSGALSSSVTVTNVVSVNVVTMPAINVTAAAPSVTTVVGTVAVSNFPAVTTVAGTVALDANSLSALENVTVIVGNSVTIGSLPAISGTVTANANLSNTFQDEYNTLLISGTLTGYWSDILKGIYFKSIDGYVKSGWTPDGTRPKIDYDYAPSGEYSGQRWRLNSTEFAPGDSSVVFYANSNTYVISAVTGWTVVTASGYSGTVNSELYFNVPVALNNTESTPIHIVGSPAVGGYPVLVNGTVTVGNSVTIGSLPAISGTVTANLSNLASHASSITKADKQIQIIGGYSGGSPTNATAYPLGVESTGYINSNLRWGGTGVLVDTGASALPVQGTVTARLQDGSGNNLTSTSIGGLQRLNVSLASAATPGGSIPTFVNVYGGSDGSAVRTISVDSSGRQNINAQFPRVTLIDGSGTVATANTAITVFASSSTRSYLLVQVTTGSAFVNVGATATTVNGINLTAGQGYSWETTIPQGIVSLISTTTNSRYVAKEA